MRHLPAAGCCPQSQAGRIAWFLVVGCASALLHWSVVVGLVRVGNWPPLLANVVGWMLAFCLSFSGHHGLSFRGHGASLPLSLRRFLLISAGGFAVNEVTYALLLKAGGWRFDLVLAVVLAAVAVITYWLGRHWAFPGRTGP